MSTTTSQPQLVQRRVLDNGITLIVVENPAADIISGRLFLREAGGRWEAPHQAGLTHLLAATATKGTTDLSALEIAEQVESVGASLSTDSTADYFLLSFKTVTADFAAILGLAAQILRSPSFPEGEVNREKTLTLQAIRSQQEQPFNVAFERLRQVMYAPHPYGVSILGTPETVANLTPADLIAYHAGHFRPDCLIVSLSGRIHFAEAVQLVEATLGDWPAPLTPPPTLTLPPLSSQPQTSFVDRDSQQAIVMLAYFAPEANNPNYPTLKLLSSYLGNGLSSRLFVELREKQGLAYDVSAFYPTRLDRSQFVVYLGTAPQNTEIAIASLRREVERLVEKVLEPQEWQGAKNKLLGQYALGKQTNAEIAQVYGWYETLGLGIDFDLEFQARIAAVTAPQAQAIAAQYLQEPYVSLVGPKAIIAPQLSALALPPLVAGPDEHPAVEVKNY